MKLAFIFLGILSATLAWRYGLPGRWRMPAANGNFLQRLLRSLAAGIAVYFVLMALAMVWLQVQTFLKA